MGLSADDLAGMLLTQMDVDGDGEISCDEFIAACKARNTLPPISRTRILSQKFSYTREHTDHLTH